jgi:hypothetical protein
MERKPSLALFILCLAIVLVLAACGGGRSPTAGAGATGATGTSFHRGATGIEGTTGATGAKGPTRSQGATGASRATAVGPLLQSQTQLMARASAIGQPVYWAGPADGDNYEFTRTPNGHVYVRYLPDGVAAGAKGAQYMIVATYSWGKAYEALQKQAKGAELKGPGGSIMWVRAADPRSVLIAWPNVPYEVEIYDPHPAVALATARSGRVRPVS